MNTLIAIAAGGALGAVMRYLASTAIYRWLGTDFPWGTLFVNVTGSLVMGLLSVLIIERSLMEPQWRGFLTIGLLGAFTTFSTFSMETLSLVQDGQLTKASLNMIASVILCVAAAWLGVITGRQI